MKSVKMCFDTVIYKYKYIWRICVLNGNRRARKALSSVPDMCVVVTRAGGVPFVITCYAAPWEHNAEQICLKTRKKYCYSVYTLLTCMRQTSLPVAKWKLSCDCMTYNWQCFLKKKLNKNAPLKFTNKPHFPIILGLDYSIYLVL